MSQAVVILAAGRGTRMQSRRPKVLHEAGGRTLLAHVLGAVIAAGVAPDDILVVAGYGAEAVRASLPAGVRMTVQEPQRGTGDAVRAAAAFWTGRDQVTVLHGDMPLLSAATVRGLPQALAAGAAAAVLATAAPAEPRAYGRILRDPARAERVVGIVEDRQATAAQREIRELNAGFYCFAPAPLSAALRQLNTDNPHGEYYLTDTIAILASAGETVTALPLADADECLGVNDRLELARLDQRLRRRKADELLGAGVSIQLPDTVVIDPEVTVGPDSLIEAGVQLLGATRVGGGGHIGAHAVLRDCELGDDVHIRSHSVLESARVAAGARIGPFARLREGAAIGADAHVGNFVEVKKSRLGARAKANHLAYIGDAELGERVNIGAGTITCNYDGECKHPTHIGDDSFIGSNSTLVAPLEIGPGSYIGAGSVITEDVPAETLALGRGRQVNKPGWVAQRRKRSD